ncbi:MAG: hypothetical protein ACYDCL_03075 [Myxococcales bacterium]
MLKAVVRRLSLALLLTGLSALALGQAEEPDDGFRRPARLTAGTGDQFLGQLAPDERTLYFVSSRNTTSEIFSQDVDEGRAARLFDEGADVTWPRVSPDGRSLLYISFRDEASGQLCVRDLPDGAGRRCLGSATGAQQAEWIDSRRLALVCRSDLEGDLHILEVAAGPRLSSRPLLERGVTNPAISPDGRWLVYLPIERAGEAVGAAFAARATNRLEAVRLDKPGPAVPFAIDLPGITGQPAFSRDGRALYLVQFLIDSNGDGAIDASDHGILFRVPFPEERDDAPEVAAAAEPEQLTDSGWNCEYPAPSAHRLVLTCSRRAALDVYELPPDGELPDDWSEGKVREELDLATRRAEQLLLYRHLLKLARDVPARRRLLVRLLRLHLAYDDIEAADFYAGKIAGLHDPSTEGLSWPLRILVAHRRALRDRDLGRAVAGFTDDERKRLGELVASHGDSPAAAALAHVVASEIADSLGDLGAARTELEAAGIDATTPGFVLEFFRDRADALYRQLDDRPALWSADRMLAEHPAFRPEERLDYARAAARTLVRGLSADAAEGAVERERRTVPSDSELAFALDLAGALLAIRDARPHPRKCAALLELYAGQSRLDRRRAVVLESVERAAEVGADRAVETIAGRYLADVPSESSEHRRAQRLYRRALMGRAFRRLQEGQTEAARSDFESVTSRTGSLEAAFEALHLRLDAGESPAKIRAEWEKKGTSGPVDRFVRAYLMVRELPNLGREEKERRAAQARALLRSDWSELRSKRLARDLYGATLEEDYLRTGDLADAERSGANYLVALELSEGHPRYQAMILGQLGVLHAEVGNYRIALDYLEQRDRLPYPDDAQGLAARLTRARVLLHVGREKDAATAADGALARVSVTPRLAGYRLLALDRAALYNLAARRFDRSIDLYGEELRLVDGGNPSANGHNALLLHLARAGAEVGARQPRLALADLDTVARLLADPALAPELRWPRGSPGRAVDTYRLIAAGLRANAALALGDLSGAGRALEERRAAFSRRLAATGRDQEISALILADGRLAENAVRRGAPADAAAWLRDAVSRSDELAARSGTALAPDLLDALWFSGVLKVFDHAALPFDVRSRLRQALDEIEKRHDRRWRSYQRWFEILLALESPTAP